MALAEKSLLPIALG